jgi:hypothetical protein
MRDGSVTYHQGAAYALRVTSVSRSSQYDALSLVSKLRPDEEGGHGPRSVSIAEVDVATGLTGF